MSYGENLLLSLEALQGRIPEELSQAAAHALSGDSSELMDS
jgi:hypothetical protein